MFVGQRSTQELRVRNLTWLVEINFFYESINIFFAYLDAKRFIWIDRSYFEKTLIGADFTWVVHINYTEGVSILFEIILIDLFHEQ